jgi:hypothetical protein
MTNVGKIVEVDLRDVWKKEATGFTPWLLKNPGYISQSLGIEVELMSSEHGVGPFSVDLIGRDVNTGDIVIIENQIEKTDHKHLGQLITYAANTDAVVIVWIARKFTDEHRQAIDYLNALGGDSGKGRFYGIEVSAIRIGDSLPAPLFEVVAKPNDAHVIQSGVVRDLIEPAGRQLQYKQYWTFYLELALKAKPEITNRKASRRNWFDVTKDIGGLAHVALVFNKNSRINVQLYISGGDAQQNQDVQAYLYEYKDDIERQIGSELVWEDNEGKLFRRVAIYKPGEWDVSMSKHYAEMANWMLKYHILFTDTFTPYLEQYSKSNQED